MEVYDPTLPQGNALHRYHETSAKLTRYKVLLRRRWWFLLLMAAVAIFVQVQLERQSLGFDMEYITVYGQVVRQGRYELAPEEDLTISQAVLRAGGFAQFAKKERVRLIRKHPDGKSRTIVVNLNDIMRKGHLHDDIPIRPNDVIIVDEKLVNF